MARYMFLTVFLLIAVLSQAYSTNPGKVKPPIKCIRPNEEYSCGSACQTTCDNYNIPCPIINIACNHMCYCKQGYARDRTGTCIPIRMCNAKNNGVCGNKEEWKFGTYYSNECLPQKLSYVSDKLILGCFCKKGYKRDQKGSCILMRNCPRTDPPKDSACSDSDSKEKRK